MTLRTSTAAALALVALGRTRRGGRGLSSSRLGIGTAVPAECEQAIKCHDEGKQWRRTFHIALSKKTFAPGALHLRGREQGPHHPALEITGPRPP